ncbi:MAG: S-methyl-5-thioribose-1-phosphate isomerase, partial [Eubacterium sp.]|nr:S-methyl-5-thioribose-1-phosphate isomerase [Eubacterium sp.]
MENIKFENGTLYLLDQTLLPNEEKYITPKTKEDYFYAIKTLQVRGAPAIGIFAAYAMALVEGDKKELKAYLDSARPTAVNLSWATARMLDAHNQGKSLIDEAIAIHNEDKEMCRKISEYGLSLLHDGDGVLTHCNAGALATSQYGTGLGPLFLGKERGYSFKVFTDETRPLLQGARLTSYELEKAGIDVTLICDNMASLVMKQGKINAVLVGADRIANNGDTANKIGTSGVAVLAKHYGIPFYVLAPYSTVDTACESGDDIIIEE